MRGNDVVTHGRAMITGRQLKIIKDELYVFSLDVIQ
jgi:hypothetical protein